jgi:hypothetical protein
MLGINFYMTLEGLIYSKVCTQFWKWRNFEVTDGRAAYEATRKVEFGYQFIICSEIEENHGKPLIDSAGRRTIQMQTDFKSAVRH